MKKAIFFDRDGTLIKDMVYLNDPHQIYYLDRCFESLKILKESGYQLFMATNQSGVARGIVEPKNLELINKLIVDEFAKHGALFEKVYFCPHPVDGGCECRKPRPGMLHQGAKEFGLDLSKCWMIGDRLSDVDAGLNAGARSILMTPQPSFDDDRRKFWAPDLMAVAQKILVEDSLLLAK